VPKCRVCGKQFPHCSSCGGDGYSEYDFCSSNCMTILRRRYEMFVNCLVTRAGHPELFNKIFDSITDESFGYRDEED